MPIVRLLFVIVLAGCSASSSSSTQPDTTQYDPNHGCIALVQQFADEIADPGTCDRDADCESIGGQLGPLAPTCDCAPDLGSCSGNAIALNAPHRAEAEATAAQFARDCTTDNHLCGAAIDCYCDCVPVSDLSCQNHRCVATPVGSCFPTPDAAP